MRRLACLCLLASCLVLASTVRGEESSDPVPPVPPSPPVPPAAPAIEVPVGIPVQIDGRMPTAEWSDAAVLPLGRGGAVLRVKQVRGTLLLALETTSPWRDGTVLWLMTTVDREDAGLYEPGALRIDYEPLEHTRPHLLVYRRGEHVEEIVDEGVLARGEVGVRGATVEFAVRLGVLGVTAESPGPIRFAALLAESGVRDHPTWPTGITMDAPQGEPPTQLASSRTWGRLQGWVDPSGPGAFPDTTWAEIREQELELTRRGRDAHAFGLLIAEETQVRKRDVEQVPAVVGNLAWIAERERLTPTDLLLLVRTYRFLNRRAEALATLDVLETLPAWRGSDLVPYERALTLRSAGRYAEAAAAWDGLARRARGEVRTRYEETAALEREREEAWAEERRRRASIERESAHLPLVEFVTSRGSVFVLLHRDDVPESVDHFLGLVDLEDEDGAFYEGTLFHRVVGDFVVQGGDPRTKQDDCDAGGPGSGPRTVDVAANARHGFWRGALGFARGPELANGCQFFILTSARPELGEQDFTCFGHVVAGMDVVDRIEMCDALHAIRVLRRGEAPGADRDPQPGAPDPRDEQE